MFRPYNTGHLQVVILNLSIGLYLHGEGGGGVVVVVGVVRGVCVAGEGGEISSYIATGILM